MLLNDHDLRQIDETYLRSLEPEELIRVSIRLLKDLKEARERLNQNSDNSSRPPSSRDPWVIARFEEAEDEIDKESDFDDGLLKQIKDIDDEISDPEEKEEPKKNSPSSAQGPKAGKQKGAKGYGRSQKLAVTGEIIHKAKECAACGRKEEAEFIARTGNYVIDIELGTEAGIRVTNTKHVYGDTICACGHVTHTEPCRCQEESGWDVQLTQWHLVGPMLMSLICCLALRMKLSRPRIQELPGEWLGLYLSVGTINQCIHESGRAVEPVEKQLVEEVIKSDLLHVDETSWKQMGKPLWLWVFCTATVALYVIGHRSLATIEKVLGESFPGWLMTDGYKVYRAYKNRLRCWAHLLRKAQGLFESLNKDAQEFGEKALAVLSVLMESIYRTRQGYGENLVEKYGKLLEQFRSLCEQYKDADHKKTRELAKEFLNDWEAIFVVLAFPYLPLTNNEAERTLRHWVILRKLWYGTRTHQGSRAFTLLASVIDTCRRRNISPWEYLANVIAERRQGHMAPPIPVAL